MSASEGRLIYLPEYNGDDPAARIQRRDGKGLLIWGSGENIRLRLVDKPHEHTPAAIHEHTLTAIEAKGATCTKAGNIAFWHCTGCNKYFSDAKGSNEIPENGWVIPATGQHSYGDWTVTEAATELAPGSRDRICAVCGHSESEVIRKLSPTLKAVSVKKPVAGKKSMIVRWKKLSRNKRREISKIQIQYSTDSKFSKNVRTAYAGKNAAKKEIKNLKSGRRYYIRVRTYKKSSTGVHISKWSKVMSVKLK
jgi:hypothetical protein